MTEFIQLLWSGILNGMLYALIGLSLVLIFKTARILNFAAGTMAGFTGGLPGCGQLNKEYLFS